MPFTFNAVERCVVTINEKSWTRAREMCRTLEYGKATKVTDIIKHLCSRENYTHKYQLSEFVPETNFMDSSKTREKMNITPMKRGCMSCYFQVNNQM